MPTSAQATPEGVTITVPVRDAYREILSPGALTFLSKLATHFEPTRQELLAARVERQKRISAGEDPNFLEDTTVAQSLPDQIVLAQGAIFHASAPWLILLCSC